MELRANADFVARRQYSENVYELLGSDTADYTFVHLHRQRAAHQIMRSPFLLVKSAHGEAQVKDRANGRDPNRAIVIEGIAVFAQCWCNAITPTKQKQKIFAAKQKQINSTHTQFTAFAD